MRHIKFALAIMAGAVLAACGGNSGSPQGGAQINKVTFASQVSFGDSLSDVGSYAVGTVKTLGGGKFTINGDNTAVNPALTGKNWTELMAAQFSLPAPCAAQTGLDGVAAQGFSVPVVNNANCFSYAQGGARVTNPVGSGHKATGSPLGALTVPLVTQVANHLAKTGGKFKGDEVVFVMAGGGDILVNLGQLSASATAAGKTAFATSLATQLAAGATNPATAAQAIGLAIASESALATSTQTSIVTAAVTAAVRAGNTTAQANIATYVATATTAANTAGANYVTAQGPALVTAMTTAGTELVALIKNRISGNGANYVVVNNLPDVANTPAGLARDAATRALIDKAVQAFNGQLTSGLASDGKVLIVDVYAVSHDQATNPGPYGLTNVTETACDPVSAKNPLGNSLGCTAASLRSGDVSHYSYADDVHPTPFNNLLLARYVSRSMVTKGWL